MSALRQNDFLSDYVYKTEDLATALFAWARSKDNIK